MAPPSIQHVAQVKNLVSLQPTCSQPCCLVPSSYSLDPSTSVHLCCLCLVKTITPSLKIATIEMSANTLPSWYAAKNPLKILSINV